MYVFTDEGQQGFAKPGGSDIVEPPLDIQLCVVPESLELVEDCPDEQKWISLFLCDLVELLVINDRPEFVIFLLEEKRGGPRGVSMVDASSCQVFIDPFLKFHTVGFWHWVELGMIRLSSIFKLDVEVHTRSVRRENIEVLLSKYLQKHGCPI